MEKELKQRVEEITKQIESSLFCGGEAAKIALTVIKALTSRLEQARESLMELGGADNRLRKVIADEMNKNKALTEREEKLAEALKRHHNYRLAEEPHYKGCGLYKTTEATLRELGLENKETGKGR